MSNYLIIGASNGIGKALAEQLEQQGHEVYATYNSSPLSGENVQYYNAMSDDFDPSFIPDSLDGLAYCPGAIDLKPFRKVTKESLLADLQVQLFGAIDVIQSVLPKLKKSSLASILLFSTVAVEKGFNYHSQVAISKGAIEGLMRSLAAEFAPTIRVNAIAPSLTDTPLAASLLDSEKKREANAQRHPLKRIGTAEDIASTAAFLMSDKASWITGQLIHVDGGKSTINI